MEVFLVFKAIKIPNVAYPNVMLWKKCRELYRPKTRKTTTLLSLEETLFCTLASRSACECACA